MTPPFAVDNQKPEVVGVAVSYPTATGKAIDALSRIDEIAWQVDGGDW